MKQIINYILWPAVAGLVFAVVLLQVPRAVNIFPQLKMFFPSAEPQVVTIQALTTNSYRDAIRVAAPAVVSINSQQVIVRLVEQENDDPTAETSYRNILDDNKSLGSGVIISPDGYIITSYHIFYTPDIGKLQENTTITLSDGRSLTARLVILDEAHDLALLKINADNLPYIGPAPQNRLEVGDVVLAIGNPRNIGQSVSMGIVSAFLSKDDSYLIQTDAAINPGNSGGALIDANGNLIGINSIIISESGGSEGIGFAIPAHKATELLNTYINGSPSGYLGVDADSLTLIEGLRKFNRVVQGITINGITANSPAEIAGIRIGDIIQAVNGQKLIISSPRDFPEAITSITNYGAGEIVVLDVFRDSITLQIPVTLGVGEPTAYFEVLESKEALEPEPENVGDLPYQLIN